MNKAERCATLTSWLCGGETFNVSDAAERLNEKYLNVWRDMEDIARVLPVFRDDMGRWQLVRLDYSNSS